MSDDITINPFATSRVFAGKKLCLGVSGSVAAYKAAELTRAFLKIGVELRATLTAGAEQFVTPMLFRALGANPVYHGDQFNLNHPFAHLEPGQSADAFLLAPASANLLARIAAGMASDFLSAQILAFDGPITAAPAMNPRMWTNPATRANVAVLRERGFTIVLPEEGDTACGEKGRGRLANLTEIFLAALRSLSPQDLAGLQVLVTLGPTREPWDGVRFWSNPSSGRMGAALATAAWLRGANTTAICGPGVNVCLPKDVTRVEAQTAKEMAEAAGDLWPAANLGAFGAAVCDFAPERPHDADNVKVKKTGSPPLIQFTRTPDILAQCVANRGPSQKILGFAAEIAPNLDALKILAAEKMNRKRPDLLAANLVNKNIGAFGANNSELVVMDKNGDVAVWESRPKADAAWELCAWLSRI